MNEADALKKWDAYLWKQAHAFYNLAEQHTLSLDDFVQEARLAFLQHIRTHDESMWAACTLTMKGAMMECVRRSYPLSVSRNHFSQTLKAGLCFTSVDEITSEYGTKWEDDHSDIDLRAALDTLDAKEQQIVNMRLEGCSVMDIANRMGMSHQAISYHLKKIRFKTLS